MIFFYRLKKSFFLKCMIKVELNIMYFTHARLTCLSIWEVNTYVHKKEKKKAVKKKVDEAFRFICWR